MEIRAKVSARIVELPFDEGERVTKGDPDAVPPVPASVLVRLDAKDLEENLRSARASRAAQAAQIEVESERISSQRESLNGTLRHCVRPRPIWIANVNFWPPRMSASRPLMMPSWPTMKSRPVMPRPNMI